MRAWRRPDTENGRIAIIVLRYFKVCIAPGGGAAVGGSLRSSLSGSRPTSHSQGHGRPCLPRPHLRPRFHKTWMERFPELLPQAKKKRPRSTPQSLKNVRAKGLEPIRTKAPDPKSGLATNYNTLANPFRKTHNIKPIAEYDLVGSCRILCPKRNTKIVKDFQFSKPVRIFVKNTHGSFI